MLLSIEIKAGAELHPELVDMLKERIDQVVIDVLFTAGQGVEFDTMYSMGDEKLAWERRDELAKAGILADLRGADFEDTTFVLKARPDVTVTLERVKE